MMNLFSSSFITRRSQTIKILTNPCKLPKFFAQSGSSQSHCIAAFINSVSNIFALFTGEDVKIMPVVHVHMSHNGGAQHCMNAKQRNTGKDIFYETESFNTVVPKA